MTTKSILPAKRWRLKLIARSDHQVIYEDEISRWAISAQDWDTPTAETNYLEWCHTADPTGSLGSRNAWGRALGC